MARGLTPRGLPDVIARVSASVSKCEPIEVLSMLFTELPIASDLVEELAAKGFTEATPVQAAVLA